MCGTCGSGFFNFCDAKECAGLGPCIFTNGFFGGTCAPDRLICSKYCCAQAGGVNTCLESPTCTQSYNACTATCGKSSSLSSSFSSKPVASSSSSADSSSSGFASSFLAESSVESSASEEVAFSSAQESADLEAFNSEFSAAPAEQPNDIVSADTANTCVENADCLSNLCTDGVCADTASAFVAAASVCGNGVLESPEECDDANRRNDDGCNENCLLEIGICGDGIVQKLLGEQCEESGFDPTLPYDCRKCRLASRSCGDGTVDLGEECDNGPMNSTSPNAACRPDCSLSRCGDGIRDEGEQCDDENLRSGDGCDRFCAMEVAAPEPAPKILADTSAEVVAANIEPASEPSAMVNAQNIVFPQFPNFQAMPMQLPMAQLQPIMQNVPHTPQSGPAAVAAIGAGAASGIAWVKRRRRK